MAVGGWRLADVTVKPLVGQLGKASLFLQVSQRFVNGCLEPWIAFDKRDTGFFNLANRRTSLQWRDLKPGELPVFFEIERRVGPFKRNFQGAALRHRVQQICGVSTGRQTLQKKTEITPENNGLKLIRPGSGKRYAVMFISFLGMNKWRLKFLQRIQYGAACTQAGFGGHARCQPLVQRA